MRNQRQQPDPRTVSWPVAGGMAQVVYSTRRPGTKHKDGTWSPRKFTYMEMPADEAAPYFVMDCECSPHDGVPRITAFHVIQREASREVRSTDLRHVRLEDALEQAWLKVTMPILSRDKRGSPPGLVFQRVTEQDKKKTLRGLRSQNRRKITQSVHQKVAEIWLADTSGAPTKAVGDHFGVAQSTASLYVQRARDAGLLPPPPQKGSGRAVPAPVQSPASNTGGRGKTQTRSPKM